MLQAIVGYRAESDRQCIWHRYGENLKKLLGVMAVHSTILALRDQFRRGWAGCEPLPLEVVVLDVGMEVVVDASWFDRNCRLNQSLDCIDGLTHRLECLLAPKQTDPVVEVQLRVVEIGGDGLFERR